MSFIKNNDVVLKQLYVQMCKLRFSAWSSVNEWDFMHGNPQLYSCFIRYILQAHPEQVLLLTVRYSWFIVQSNDEELIRIILKVLSNEKIRIPLTVAQFQQQKFATQKATLCLVLIKLLSSRTRLHLKSTENFCVAAKEVDDELLKRKKEIIINRAQDYNRLQRI